MIALWFSVDICWWSFWAVSQLLFGIDITNEPSFPPAGYAAIYADSDNAYTDNPIEVDNHNVDADIDNAKDYADNADIDYPIKVNGDSDDADNDKANEVDETDANISARCATYGIKAESDTWGPANPAPRYTPGHPGQKPMMIDITIML